MNNILSNIGELISQNMWIALIAAFVGGILSSFSPCNLSTIPLLIGYVEGKKVDDKRYAFKCSLVFSLGVIITFTLIGILSAILGKYLSFGGKVWYLILGVIMFLSAMNLFGLFTIGKKSCSIRGTNKGLLGAFFLGILGGALSSPCSTPVLASILAFVSVKGDIAFGTIMLLLYAIGYNTLIIIAGTSVGIVRSLSSSEKTYKVGEMLKKILAVVILLGSIYLFYLVL